jgi:hypothetical protein
VRKSWCTRHKKLSFDEFIALAIVVGKGVEVRDGHEVFDI